MTKYPPGTIIRTTLDGYSIIKILTGNKYTYIICSNYPHQVGQIYTIQNYTWFLDPSEESKVSCHKLYRLIYE